jgi:DNA-binding transcriptional LysR family regulator
MHATPCLLGQWGGYGAAMPSPDLNLLLTLDALLAEASVAGAARRLQLSASAMSRALARLRTTTGDPLLVRAGRGLVPTPRALELREQVAALVQGAQAALRPTQTLDLAQLERSFTLRTREGFVENFGARLVARVQQEAPGVRLRFVPKLDKDSSALRQGLVDLETGVLSAQLGPELRAQALLRDRFIGVVRAGHALSQGQITPERYAAGQHIGFSRRGTRPSAVEAALQALGLPLRTAVWVSDFASALALARQSELIACVPQLHTGWLRDGMHSFALPFAPPLALPEFSLCLLWHPRMEADAAHRWLRGLVRQVCASSAATQPL